jgi:SPP1 family predicted phage head-tail adaptor
VIVGRLRHRITIEQSTETRDANGDRVPAWNVFAADVPAAFQSGPGREYLAAEAIRAEVAGRFNIRYLPGVTAQMRVLWDGLVWNIKAPPIVDPTARREMTLLVGAGVNDG